MNRKDFMKYSIGFIACFILIILIRVFIRLNDAGVQSDAAPLTNFPVLYQAGNTSPFWWVPFTGVRLLPDPPPDTTTCLTLFDDDGNRYYYCGPELGE